MRVERITFATRGDVAAAPAELAAVVGASDGFRDGDAWYHVDVPGSGLRLAVSGADGGVDAPTLLVKVADLDAAREELLAAGVAVGTVERGAHERRLPVTLSSMPSVRVVLYSPATG